MSASGLPAGAYAKLVDVDPPIAEHVLDLLAQARIPAHAEPLVGDTGPYRDVRAPDRPTTRIYVEKSRLVEARHAISDGLPSLRAEFHADAAARADADDMKRASADRIEAAWDDWPAQSPEDAAARYMRALEARIAAHPSQYLWMHRRFKTRPPGEPPLY